MATLVGEGTHSLHDTGVGAAVSGVSDEALASLVQKGDSELQLERAAEARAGILYGLSVELSRDIRSFRVRNSRVVTPSSRDGSIQSVLETMRVDVSDEPELFTTPPYVHGEIIVDDNHRLHSEPLTEALGAQALRYPTQVEHLHPYWFLG